MPRSRMAIAGNEAAASTTRCAPELAFHFPSDADAQSLLRATEIARAANPSVSSQPPRRTVPTGTARTVKRRSSPTDGISASTSDGSSRQQAQ